MAVLQPIQDYSIPAPKPLENYLALRGQVLSEKKSALDMEGQQQEIDRFNEDSNLRSMVTGAQKYLSLPKGDSEAEDQIITDRFLNQRLEEIKSSGRDPRDTLEMLQMPLSQRKQVIDNLIKIGESRGILNTGIDKFRVTAEERAKTMGMRQEEITGARENRELTREATAQNRKQAQFNREQTALDRKEQQDRRSEERELARGDRNKRAAEKIRVKIEKEDENDQEKLARLQINNQDSMNSIIEIENELGFALEDYDYKTNKVKGLPGEVDLPGVSIFGVGRFSAYSDRAKLIQSRASKIFNIVLKDRSGAAVTTQEMQRLKTEFGEGKFNTEPELLRAMQLYKKLTLEKMQQLEAGFSPKVKQMYKDQGGKTSEFYRGVGAKSGGQSGKVKYNPATTEFE